ncbi:MAG: FAD-dependent oxidoreductase [Candidatus Woesearchaeota archaeon]
MINTYETTISNLQKKGRVLMLRLDFAKDVQFSFTPGQFIMVNYKDEQGEFKRSYSIASDPEHKHYIELCVSLKEGGRGSTLLAKAKKGDKLKISGPFGAFHLEDKQGEIILIAGGTGISPLRSMIKHLLNIKYPHKVYLFYSFKTEDDYLYKEEFEKLAKENKNFVYIPICTQAGPKWKGEKEYVQKIFKKYVKGTKNKDIYACGPVPMVDAVFQELRGFGFRPEQLHREIWTV